MIKFTLWVLTFLVIHTQGFCQSEADTAINQTLEQYKEAFNNRDLEKLAALWAEDALYVNYTTHETLQGRKEIEKFFKDQFENESLDTLSVTILSSSSHTPEKILEKGIATTKDEKGEEKKSAFAAEFTKKNGTWFLQRVFEVEMQEPSSHYEQLKELAWLVGKWGVHNELLDLSNIVKWDENKNFLKQNISVDFLGQKDLNIEQIIGWDPENQKIHSWMFDSDGGYGEGKWSKQGDHWYVSMVFTLPDGRKGSATQIYTKVDDNTFTFASEDREVEGKMLPSIEALKLSKVQ